MVVVGMVTTSTKKETIQTGSYHLASPLLAFKVEHAGAKLVVWPSAILASDLQIAIVGRRRSICSCQQVANICVSTMYI